MTMEQYEEEEDLNNVERLEDSEESQIVMLSVVNEGSEKSFILAGTQSEVSPYADIPKRKQIF